MSGKYATPLRLELGRSRLLARYLRVLHATALVMLPFLQLPALPGILLALLVLLSYLHYRRLYWQRDNPDAVTGLVWGSDDRLRLSLASGRSREASLLPQAFVQPWLVILGLRHGHGRRQYLLLLPDMLASEGFRRLRVRLLLEMKPAVQGGRR